jgi:hypothetical protein
MTILAVGAAGKFAAWSFPPWLNADREYAAWSASRIRPIRCEVMASNLTTITGVLRSR